MAHGTLVLAIGADSPDKQELDVELVESSVIIVDIVEQSATVGELHHAIEAGLVGIDHVRATLGQVIAGIRQGRRDDAETIIFDSTGTAIQDAATAKLVYDRACTRAVGIDVEIAR